MRCYVSSVYVVYFIDIQDNSYLCEYSEYIILKFDESTTGQYCSKDRNG